ncbi:GNAT family N-acetyltransferase [Candidatus Dojkabacteria bacterium]|uniref:GNAT family N-acetyltransferase n=1 Tax=Candidatus Dojkabacteria bacterium TaxID=2099670 RepID=A0A955L8B2_9BACT|nr:GNAT family N-acetyltransferase [Candidatus Dojkabacteria bacterium]
MKTIHKITDQIYFQIKNFEGYGIYHTKEWHTFLEKVYGWKVRAVVSYDHKGELELFLPFVTKKRLGKEISISLPLSHFIPVLSKNGSEDIKKEQFPTKVELHTKISNWDYAQRHVLSIREIPKGMDEDELFASLQKSSIQRKIKQARNKGVKINSSFEYSEIENMYRMHVQTRKHQGSPMYPRNYFHELLRIFEESNYIVPFIAYKGGKPQAVVIFAYCNGTATYMYGASFTHDYGVNQFAMWEGFKEALRRNCTRIDMGSSPLYNIGLRNYKKKWGAHELPLIYSYSSTNLQKNIPNRTGFIAKAVGTLFKVIPTPLYASYSPIILKCLV